MTLLLAAGLATALGATASAPADAPPLHLADVLARVSEAAPAVRVGAASVGVARAAVDVAGVWEDALVTAMAEEMPFGSNPEAMPMIRYRLMQPITPLYGRRMFAKEGASARVDAVAAGLERTRWDARAQAVASFYELWVNGELQQVVGRQLTVLQRMKEAAKARYATGSMTAHHEFLRAESESAAMEAERRSLEDERGAVVAMLNVLLGNPADAPLGTPQLPERPDVPVLADLGERVQRAPEVVGARAARSEAAARRRLMGTMYWPMVMVGVAFEQQLAMEHTWGGEIAFRFPLWWERPNAEVAMADAMMVEAERDIEAMTAMKLADSRVALSRARAAHRRLEVLEKTALPSMAETVKSSEAAYAAGTGEFLMLLDSTLALTDLEVERVRTTASRSTFLYELSRLLGQDVGGVGGQRP